ncbi:hypothetical protein KNU94_gp33 [Xanthomonas phage FoX2]|uniref:Uncharacterized protein n=1 Tax=Xanthomonas phage FoX2 TaxID=2723898 RepID=A0A858NN03_9CAUD|nr:hypothetical protein KNU94_gp33 [Xanthomonas phage FoX2]QJB21899.1 hypothetical protein XccvBFoX2_gp80 [Xanthomonas phage FoX2]
MRACRTRLFPVIDEGAFPVNIIPVQYRLTVKIVTGLVVCILFFLSGYQLRGLQAKVVEKTAEASVAREQVQVVTQARADDKLTQVGANAVEAIRVDQAAATQQQFKIIYQDVIRYVQSNPSPAACDADGEWLRIYNAANKGGGAKPDVSSGPVGQLPR